jgi:hypothetical protein
MRVARGVFKALGVAELTLGRRWIFEQHGDFSLRSK